eukprot:355767-Chlamydomonas_euryale.AAC.12
MGAPLHAGAELATGHGFTWKLGLAGVCWRRCTVLALPVFGPGYRVDWAVSVDWGVSFAFCAGVIYDDFC